MKIQPVSTWQNGKEVLATELKLQISYDNLKDCARFIFSLQTDVKEIEGYQTVSNGELFMENPDYELWNNSSSINDEAYAWAAKKLNLVIV